MANLKGKGRPYLNQGPYLKAVFIMAHYMGQEYTAKVMAGFMKASLRITGFQVRVF